MAENRNEEKNVNVCDKFQYVSGKFYRMNFNGTAHLEYINGALCDMLGYSSAEIYEKFGGRYAELIHRDDREMYKNFLGKLQSEECSLMVQYRLVAKGGDVIQVSDTMTLIHCHEDGQQVFSVVTVIADVLTDNKIMRNVGDAVPCGIVRFTCEQYPSIIAMNCGMIDMIGIECIGSELFQDIKENIFSIILFEYRRAFRNALKRIDKDENDVNLDMDIFKCDGKRIPVTVWLYKVKAGLKIVYQGVFIGSDVYIPGKREALRRDFLNALTYVYDAVYELNITDKTVKCLCTQHPDAQNIIAGVRMLANDIVEYWCRKIPEPPQKKIFMDFFSEILNDDFDDTIPHSLEFSIDFGRDKCINIAENNDNIRHYSGTFFKINESTGAFCCSDMSAQQRRFTETGAHSNIMEFKLKDNMLKPLNITEETRRFIGLSPVEIDKVLKEGTDIDIFFTHCPLSSENVRAIINGPLNVMAEYTVEYGDGRVEKRYASMIACGVDASDAFVHYALRYNIVIPENRAQLQKTQKEETENREKRIQIRTFGFFDVFIDGKAVPFKSSKAKELLAVLVDRRGGYVSAGDAISYLWENEDANKITLARYRKVAMRLRKELEENGISDIMIQNSGKRCINLKIVQCDLYDYLSDKEKNGNLFNGVYLQNYSWGEYTLPELMKL